MQNSLIYDSFETLADVIEHRMDLRATCFGCGVFSQSPWHKLPKCLPPDTPVRLVGAYFRCKFCRSRKIYCQRIVTNYWAYVR